MDAQRGSISQPLSSHNTLSDTFNLWTTTDDYGNVQGKDLPQSRDDVEEMPSSLSERGQNVLASEFTVVCKQTSNLLGETSEALSW